MQTPRPLMFVCIFNLFEFTFCLLFVKSVCVTTTFPLVTHFSKHHMFIRYNILFFSFFCFFSSFWEKRKERGATVERWWTPSYTLSAVPFVLRSDPRRPLSLRLFSLVVGVFSSSLSFLSNSSVLFSVFALDFISSSFLRLRNWLPSFRFHTESLSEPTPSLGGATVLPGTLKSVYVLFSTRAQSLSLSRHRCDSYMRPSRFIDARTDNSTIVYRVYSSHVSTARAQLRFPFLSTIRSNSLGTTHSFFVTSSIYSFRLVSLSFFISTFFFSFFLFRLESCSLSVDPLRPSLQQIPLCFGPSSRDNWSSTGAE